MRTLARGTKTFLESSSATSKIFLQGTPINVTLKLGCRLNCSLSPISYILEEASELLDTSRKATHGSAKLQRRLALIFLVLCSASMAVAFGVRTAPVSSGQTPIEALHVPELDAGFHFLYELKPEEAHKQFEAFEKSHPEDPLGSAADAAAYLFEECYRQGVLTSEFFLDNKRFLGKTPLQPDPKLRAAFFASDQRAQDLAQMQLKSKPDDPNALFAMTLSMGLLADYASLIDKHQIDSLKKIGEADTYAEKLLVIAPDAADAYLGLGTANYVIGSLPGIKRLVIGLAGIHGNKKVGIQQLQIAADHGRYLRPFAKILL